MNKRVLITGVTGALGGATAFEIAKSGAAVVLLSRNKEKLENLKDEISRITGNPEIEILISDLSDIDSTKNAIREFKQRFDRLDVLINIAAVYKSKRVITRDNLELMFATNHIAPFILTDGLLDLLKSSKPARIITVTAPSSTKIKFDDLQGEKKFSALYSFGSSKMMNLMFTYFLARQLEGTGVTVSAFHPGLLKSGLTREMPLILRYLTGLLSGKPDKAANMLCSLALDGKYSDSNGRFYKYNGKEIKTSSYSYDIKYQEDLQTISEQLSRRNPAELLS
jgi:NAD(P)-dependent dehydrogenase (short-subunit alcohol dehydrogenase family)